VVWDTRLVYHCTISSTSVFTIISEVDVAELIRILSEKLLYAIALTATRKKFAIERCFFFKGNDKCHTDRASLNHE